MKKLLLSVLALAGMTFAANAEVIVDKMQDYKGLDKFPFFVMGYEPEIVDGILTVPEYPGEWYQFFVTQGLQFDTECKYTVTAKIKGSEAGTLNVQLGDWGNLLEQQMSFTSEWAEQSVEFFGLKVEGGFSVFQPGTYPGKLEIEWVKVSHEGEAFVVPTTGYILGEYYTGNDKTFGGWGGSAKFENVEEDGKPCLKFTNPEAATNSWDVQMAINYDFIPGMTYYIGFDIKGNPATGIANSLQAARDWKGAGDFTPFDITEEWQHVIVYGKAKDAAAEGEEPNLPTRWLASLGKYVGTFYMTNVVLYSEEDAGVDEVIAPVENTRTVVYNLMGVKVLDTDDAAEVNNLAKGLYIVNGKKVAIR